MRSKFYDYTANGLRERPMLVVALILLLYSLLQYKFYHFTRRTLPCIREAYDDDGILYAHAHVVLSVVIAVLMLIGLMRMGAVNLALRRKMVKRYKEIQGAAEKKQYREIVARIRFKGNLYQKTSRLISIAPHSFLNILLLLATSILCIQGFRFCKNKAGLCTYALDSWKFDLCFYLPWALTVLWVIFMIFNDFYVSEQLERYLDGHFSREIDWKKQLDRFALSLTPAEQQYFQTRYVDRLSRKEIMEKFHVEESTVKTHINNINHKWKSHLNKEQLPFLNLKTASSTFLHP